MSAPAPDVIDAPTMPLIDVAGTSYECGRQLGDAWGDSLRTYFDNHKPDGWQWWCDRAFAPLVDRYVPQLPDLYRGIAHGAGVDADRFVPPVPGEQRIGCTSFAVDGWQTVDGIPISGQTKDTPWGNRIRHVVRMRPTDAPAALTMTYPGVLYGHGFVAGRCTVFRNSLYAGDNPRGRLPYTVWGLMSLYGSSVEDAIELANEYGVSSPFHCTVIDSDGNAIGIENGAGGIAVLEPVNGIYTHANDVCSTAQMQAHEQAEADYVRRSTGRRLALRDRLAANAGRLSPQVVYGCLADHTHFPGSVCNHESADFMTSASIIARPSVGQLWVTSGPPCTNWPRLYALTDSAPEGSAASCSAR